MKNNLPKLGKIHPDFFNQHIYAKLGKPDKSISEGTLLVTANSQKAKSIVVALEKAGIPASIVGQVTAQSKGMRILDGDKSYELQHPRVDPFWGKFAEYLNKK
mgnify:CR=1 FL=1